MRVPIVLIVPGDQIAKRHFLPFQKVLFGGAKKAETSCYNHSILHTDRFLVLSNRFGVVADFSIYYAIALKSHCIAEDQIHLLV